MKFYGDISHRILEFVPLWKGAIVELIPFRHQDHLPIQKFVYLGRTHGRDNFIRRDEILSFQRIFHLFPDTYKFKFKNVRY